jgi:hypothetical protein
MGMACHCSVAIAFKFFNWLSWTAFSLALTMVAVRNHHLD